MNFFIFLWNFKIGGIQKHGVLLANHMVELGWVVTILYCHKEGDLLQKLDNRVHLSQFKVPNTNNPIRLLGLFKALKRQIPKSSIILCNGPNNFRQVGRLNFLYKRWKLLYILQNDLEFDKKKGRHLKQLEIRLICNSSESHIVALSKNQKKDHEVRLRLKGLEVIPNFIDFDHSHLTKLNEKAPKGVSIGRYADQKGYDILLEAMKHVDKGIKVDIYGFGEEERLKLRSKAEENRVTNIVFNGPILNVYQAISEYDFFILSSRFEPFGIVVAEALSCGLPVLSTDCDGPIDVINELNGVIVKKNSPEALATGIDRICEKIKNHSYTPDSIRKSAEQYSIETVFKKYLRILEQ